MFCGHVSSNNLFCVALWEILQSAITLIQRCGSKIGLYAHQALHVHIKLLLPRAPIIIKFLFQAITTPQDKRIDTSCNYYYMGYVHGEA